LYIALLKLCSAPPLKSTFRFTPRKKEREQKREEGKQKKREKKKKKEREGKARKEGEREKGVGERDDLPSESVVCGKGESGGARG
jgi:hypothetical protein